MEINEDRIGDELYSDATMMEEVGTHPSQEALAHQKRAFAEAERLDNPPERASHDDSYAKRWTQLHERRERSQLIQAENEEGLR